MSRWAIQRSGMREGGKFRYDGAPQNHSAIGVAADARAGHFRARYAPPLEGCENTLMNTTPPPISPRRRLQDLLAIPERQRTDEEWDEINELEIKLASANREDAPDPNIRRNQPAAKNPGGPGNNNNNNNNHARRNRPGGGGGGGGQQQGKK